MLVRCGACRSSRGQAVFLEIFPAKKRGERHTKVEIVILGSSLHREINYCTTSHNFSFYNPRRKIILHRQFRAHRIIDVRRYASQCTAREAASREPRPRDATHQGRQQREQKRECTPFGMLKIGN